MKKLLLLLLFFVPLFATAQEVYHIRFLSGGVKYRVAVVLYSDDTGKMRVRYNTGSGDQLWEMDVTLNEAGEGFSIDGANPHNVKTGSKTGYSADHFYVALDEDGQLFCSNSDDAESSSDCCIMEVIGPKNQSLFLRDYDWTLD